MNNKKAIAAILLCSGLFMNIANATDVYTLENGLYAGDVKAQYELGVKYINGDGVEKNYLKGSVLVYASAYTQKDSSLTAPIDIKNATNWQRNEIARLGEELAKNNPDAWKTLWVNTSLSELHKLADKGDATALYHLGLSTRSAEEAFTYFEKAARKNNIPSQVILAEIYNTVGGVKQDASKSLEWTRKAAENGDADSQVKMYRYYCGNFGDLVEKNEHTANEWLQKAIDQGDAYAMQEKSWNYARGDVSTPKDINKSLELYKKSMVIKINKKTENYTDYSSFAYLYLLKGDNVKSWVLFQMAKKISAQMGQEFQVAEEDLETIPVLSLAENKNAKNVLSTSEGKEAKKLLAALEKNPSSIANW
ncbi:sel1 repeat family protein [Salmonella enterica subsp. salamae]|nr:sel1 repeat family protein [Salmonella enterica subsp. salamae]